NWSARFGTCCFLDNQSYISNEPGYECVVAVGEKVRLKTEAGNAFSQLREFSQEHNDWLFGHFSFDLKSETEQTPSLLPDLIQFPGLFFFVPEIVLLIHAHEIEIGIFTNDHRQLLDEIENHVADTGKNIPPPVLIQNRISKAEYIQVIESLKQHILRGDCYEINFCQEFFVESANLDPLELYRALTSISPSPFSAYYSVDDHFLLCASPERFLKRRGDNILSQPIKGTAARDPEDATRDELLRTTLAGSEKDRAENVMVVDLVRNDLSKICETDTVYVSELFGIYSFPQVHQMISTIMGKPRSDLYWTDMVARTFPMGSMTGAPKKRVLELIEQYEKSKRGLFSGALGYVKPNQDFDFNVVIRSLLYNRTSQYLAYFAGSGITFNSDPEKEYEECLLKVAAFERIIKNPSHRSVTGYKNT
ncbi:MAG TPA: anthranilate synthase component I family protein, partial [Puia sp.]|nr:anthranilate synthase component I family protein [Puia sp.]